MDGQREMYQLDLNIVGLQFSHHPLFNQEQVLCARLLQLCESFQDRQKQSLSQLLYEKVRGLLVTFQGPTLKTGRGCSWNRTVSREPSLLMLKHLTHQNSDLRANGKVWLIEDIASNLPHRMFATDKASTSSCYSWLYDARTFEIIMVSQLWFL